ncbi:MAG: transposase DNA-binding-containing protein [Pseudomonadota bacterium]
MDGASDGWFDRELAGYSFADERLNKRLRKLVAQIGSAMGQSIPLVCQDWANTKAAYRFFANDRVSEADILAGHFQSTGDRAVAVDGPLLVLHDTTEFSYQRENVDAIGITKAINSGRDKAGRVRAHTVCGILMHSSLAVTTEGLPLGWRPSNSGPGRNSREPPRSRRRSIRRGCPSRRRKASGGWRTSSNPRRCSASPDDAFTSPIVRATSTSCSARLEKPERTS